MTQPAYLLDEPRRSIVLSAILSVCEFRRWKPFAVHVRQNHVHIVLEVSCPPEQAAQDFKEYASRYLNLALLDSPGRKRWTRHHSVRLVASPEARRRAIHYVATNQGEPMALYVAEERAP